VKAACPCAGYWYQWRLVFWTLPPEIDQALRLGVQEAYWRLKSFGIIKDTPTS
jgi:hypothetical protein